MSINIFLVVAALASIAIAFVLGVFEPRRIRGPQRLGPAELPGTLVATIGFALMAWAFSILAIGAAHQTLMKKQGKPADTKLSDAETVTYGAMMDGAVLVAMVALTVAGRRDGIKRIGVGLNRMPGGVVIGVLGIAMVLPVIFYVNAAMEIALDWFGRAHPPHDLLEVLKTNPPAWLRIADVLSAGFLAPVTEEFFFRGLLQTVLGVVTKNRWTGVVLAAGLFAAVHAWYTWPQIFFLGVCLGYVYERTGNLWATITMHAMFNLTSIYLFVHYG
jgi:membrane protease YdiL (CAAX protease family)